MSNYNQQVTNTFSKRIVEVYSLYDKQPSEHSTAFRLAKNTTFLFPGSHRYQGPRESEKIRRIVWQTVQLRVLAEINILPFIDNIDQVFERTYPDESLVATIQELCSQIEKEEFLLIRHPDFDKMEY
jgi:hypothetical protein